jgi:hypothetical protein
MEKGPRRAVRAGREDVLVRVEEIMKSDARVQPLSFDVPGLDYIRPGDPRAVEWGFTPERWRFDSYLVVDGDRILCSLLTAKESEKGYFRDLVHGIEGSGLRVAVPCPLGDMKKILVHYGFVPHAETDECGTADVWERPR